MELIIVLIIIFFVVNSKKAKSGESQSGRVRDSARDARSRRERQRVESHPPNAGSDMGFRELRETLQELAAQKPESIIEAAQSAIQSAKSEHTPIEAARAAKAAAEIAAAKAAAREKLQAARRAKAGGLPIETEAHAQGDSAADDEGCLGGSMAHTHSEGESRAEHAGHVAAAKRREAQELLQQADSERRTQVTAQKLRQAVVMAEVLGKPRALRGYGRGQAAR